MFLMNGDIKALWFDTEDYLIKVLNNKMLPYQLKDNIKNSEDLTSISEHIRNYDKLRHFFADRVLSLSRENAKNILQSLNENQRLSEEQSYQLSLKCRGLSVSDNFWTKQDEEEIAFADVNIRKQSLNEAIFQVSMKGTPVSLQHSMLAADISLRGMFKKTWVREDGELYLYKSDNTLNYTNTKNEIKVSNMLDKSTINHVRYTAQVKDDVFCCKCKCFVDDDTSFVEAEYIKGWIERNGGNFIDYIKHNFKQDFANMVVCDYLFANPNRHINNWGFLVDSDNNEIKGLAPLFDHNQALIAFDLHKEKEFNELIYGPTNKPMLASIIEWLPSSNVEFTELPEIFANRLKNMHEVSHAITKSLYRDEEYEL